MAGLRFSLLYFSKLLHCLIITVICVLQEADVKMELKVPEICWGRRCLWKREGEGAEEPQCQNDGCAGERQGGRWGKGAPGRSAALREFLLTRQGAPTPRLLPRRPARETARPRPGASCGRCSWAHSWAPSCSEGWARPPQLPRLTR